MWQSWLLSKRDLLITEFQDMCTEQTVPESPHVDFSQELSMYGMNKQETDASKSLLMCHLMLAHPTF